jgi:hypothetical protein
MAEVIEVVYLEVVVFIIALRQVWLDVDFDLNLGFAKLTGRLIPMAFIKSEHQIVGYIDDLGNVGSINLVVQSHDFIAIRVK